MKWAKIFLAVLVVSWLVGILFYQWRHIPEPRLVDVQKRVEISQQQKPYTSILTLVDVGDFTVPAYPYVDTSPTQKKYYFTLAKETYNAQEEPIFYAHKRVAEAVKFYQSFTEADWKRLLVEYKKYINQEIATIDATNTFYVKDTLNKRLVAYLSTHYRDLEALIPQTQDGKYVRELVQSTFAQLRSQFPTRLQSEQNYIYYPVDIVTQRQFGSYVLESQIPISTSSSQASISASLSVNDSVVPISTHLTKSLLVARSEPIEINSIDDVIVLHIQSNATSAAQLSPIIRAEESTVSAFQPGKYSVDKRSADTYQLTLFNFSTEDQSVIAQSYGKGWRSRLLAHDGLNSVYLLEYTSQKLLSQLLFLVVPFLIVLLATWTLMSSKVRPIRSVIYNAASPEKIIKLVNYILKTGHTLLLPFRVYLFWMFLLGLVVDVVVLSTTSIAWFTILLLCIWLAVALAFHIRERTHFVIGYVCLLCLPVLMILNLQNIASKLTNWAYLFFALGAGELIVRQMFRDTQRDSSGRTLLALFTNITLPFHKIFRILLAFVLINLQIISRLAWFAAIAILLLVIASNFSYQSNFYERYYILDPSSAFFWKTIVYQLGCLVVYLLVAEVVRKRIRLSLRILFFFIAMALIQYAVFQHTSYQLRTQAVVTGMNRVSGSMWNEVTIYGNNFGNAPYNGAAVYVNGYQQRILVWQNDKIIFVVDPHTTPTGKLWVVNVNQQKTQEVGFEYIPI